MEQYDVLVIGLGPAGMAVTAMASAMGLKVCAIERERIGGECGNVGCIPSKGLLRLAKHCPLDADPLARVDRHVSFIRDAKMGGVLKKAEIIKGQAAFLDKKTVAVADRRLSAKRIFLAVGTKPRIPDMPGLSDVPYLTNETVFSLPKVPESMLILGGGPIGVELALAFHRLGCRCTLVGSGKRLVPRGEPDASKILEEKYAEYGIKVLTGVRPVRAAVENNEATLFTESGETLRAEKLLVATGRKTELASLNLEAAGIAYGPKGIIVDKYLRTGNPSVYAVGDCNGGHLLSHAAMHQGMVAVMNLFLPFFMRKDYRKYPVPWTVFSDPEISHVGMTSRELREKNIPYEVVESRYEDYGAAIVQEVPDGFIRVYAGGRGKILGVSIMGEHSGELINEWALAMQNNLNLYQVMMTMHSFPTMGFMSKRIGEIWMMGLVQKPIAQRLLRWFGPGE